MRINGIFDKYDINYHALMMLSDERKISKSFMTTREAALLLGVSLQTVQNWTGAGLLDCWKTEGGHRRIPRESVERLLAKPESAKFARRTRTGSGNTARVTPLRIFVLDDDLALLRLYQLRVSDWSIAPEVTTVNNGIESLLQLGRALPDLLITDLNMPQTDGFQVLHAIRAMPEFDSLEIVVVTGIGQEEISARGGLPAGIQVLPKPIPFHQLEHIAEQLAVRLSAAPASRGRLA